MALNEKEMVDKMFQKCAERGWLKKLVPSVITEQEIAGFEEKYDLKLPEIYKAFLMSYQLSPDHRNMFDINGIVYNIDEITPLWLTLYSVNSIDELYEWMETFREIAEAYGASADQCRNLIPIGDWGAGWGPLCIDLTQDEQLVDEDDETTWSLVWFEHEYMDWLEYYLGEDGLLHGDGAAPDFKTLLDWYFCGSLEAQFEAENQVKVNYERLNDMEFCSSFEDEKWKV